MNKVYILHSKKLNRYYTGFTSNLEGRIGFHNHPEARKFTAKSDDWELFLTLDCQSKAQGLAVEKYIKAMKSKTYIKNLKKYREMQEKLLNKFS